MFDTFNALWRELADEGRISKGEYLSTNFPQVYRNAEEFTAPLRDCGSQVHHGGLRLEHVEERHLVCPYAKSFAVHKDAERFAREYIPTLRSWSEPTFAAGLEQTRPAAERMAILDEFYGRYECLVAKSPAGHGMDYIHVHMVCVKE
jgi:hypothetical protein